MTTERTQPETAKVLREVAEEFVIRMGMACDKMPSIDSPKTTGTIAGLAYAETQLIDIIHKHLEAI